jgi:hypothetical protein
MPDWRAFVRERLAWLGLGAARDEEIRAELAEHLEDAYQHALDRGLPPEAAMAVAHEQVPDWQRLARKIRRAGQEDEVTSTARTIWVPGVSVLFLASVMLLVMTRVVPPTVWTGPNGPLRLLGPWLASYFAFGALGAYLSRRAGGGTAARFYAGVFPLAMQLTIFVLAIVMTVLSGGSKFPEHRQLGWLLKTSFMWIVIPGLALSLGTLPFLRSGTPART